MKIGRRGGASADTQGYRGLDRSLVARYWELLAGGRPWEAGARVLDMGCGYGCIGRHKPSPAIEVFGIDRDPRRAEIASAWETVSVLALGSDALPYATGTFTAIVAKDILEHLPDPLAVLAEMRRVLAPGGRLVVSVPMEYPWVVWNDYTHHRGFTREALRTMLTDGGFDVVDLSGMGAVPGAGRIGLASYIPLAMRIPALRLVFGRSWEAAAVRRDAM